ncbi:MAG: hypothetical protein WCZ20_10465 [Hydrogenophaga sp.]|jgi:hypothetical protein|nr:hypothetical protein [Hydrogenophaga sp.]MDD3784148.1 hypothetical protein [Hydrogenophaga sp.]MDX9969282.1 hypothetical protein [Hydrogenophaga sp.]
MSATRRRRGWQAMAWLAVVLALLGTLLLYRDPDFAVRLADQLWSCF